MNTFIYLNNNDTINNVACNTKGNTNMNFNLYGNRTVELLQEVANIPAWAKAENLTATRSLTDIWSMNKITVPIEIQPLPLRKKMAHVLHAVADRIYDSSLEKSAGYGTI